MIKVPQSIVNRAIDNATWSEHRFRVGAVIYFRNRVYGNGFNDPIKTHPRSPHPYKVRDAEFSALLDATSNLGNGRNGVSGMSIYVHRLKKDNSPGLAKPCQFCEKMLTLAGIRDINYSV